MSAVYRYVYVCRECGEPVYAGYELPGKPVAEVRHKPLRIWHDCDGERVGLCELRRAELVGYETKPAKPTGCDDADCAACHYRGIPDFCPKAGAPTEAPDLKRCVFAPCDSCGQSGCRYHRKVWNGALSSNLSAP